ncbi:hypothetical protein AB0L13_05565 [Saccharopolyspora shandongensis]|uniref:hypothetical protein n=1 Tax=Saccharopolyspora shandongensis TaxID=418495 RepID=UPI00341BD0F0
MAALLGSAITAFLFVAGIFYWYRRESGQHGCGSGEDSMGVWQLCAQVAAERQRELEAETYGRHALRRTFDITRSGDDVVCGIGSGPVGADDDPHG